MTDEDDISKEVQETVRKVGWKIYLEANGVASTKRAVMFKKGTALPRGNMRDDLVRSTHNIHRLVHDEITTWDKERHLPSVLNALEWKHALQACNGRWIICDKNLGVKHVDNDEYEFLMDQEASRYIRHTTNIDDTEKRIIAIKIEHLEELVLYHTPDPQCSFKGDLWYDLREMVKHDLTTKTFKLPKLKLMLKIHKDKKNGHWQTRPIVPTMNLPEYGLSKWIGRLLAKFARAIPWVLEDTGSFVTWLTARSRSGQIRTFDFSTTGVRLGVVRF